MKTDLENLLFRLENQKANEVKCYQEFLDDKDDLMAHFTLGKHYAFATTIQYIKGVLKSKDKTEQSEVNNT